MQIDEIALQKNEDMIEMFKYFKVYGKAILPPSRYPCLYQTNVRNGKRRYQIYQKRSRAGERGLHYFRVTKQWNELPSYMVE